jgi:hypothetical protein
MVCILAKDPVTAKSPAHHDHLLHRILLNLLNATAEWLEGEPLAGGKFRIRQFGEWVLASGAHPPDALSHRRSGTRRLTKIAFDAQDLTAWENILIQFLNKLETVAGERGISVVRSGLPGEAKILMMLARTRSVAGLTVGSLILFRGVPLGQVVEGRVRYDPADKYFEIPIIIQNRPDVIQKYFPQPHWGGCAAWKKPRKRERHNAHCGRHPFLRGDRFRPMKHSSRFSVPGEVEKNAKRNQRSVDDAVRVAGP